jgi:nucleotide-binding universal stress UspA family protein
MFSTIVVGVDGHQGGRDALALAQRLRELTGSAVVAVHVYPYEPFPLRDLRLDIEALGRDDAQALLQAQLADVGAQAEAIVTADTSPGRGMHRIADGLDADLVIIGSAHRGPVGRVVVGDTARAILQGADRPVMVARPKGARGQMTERVVGVGYDGSPESRGALAWAGRLAESIGGTVRVLCAAEPPQGFTPSISYGINWVALTPERTEHAERLAAEAAGQLGDRATGEAIVGIAHDELVRLSHEVDLLVLGSRGYGPVRRTLLGSTSDRVAHAAACPVVVIPRGAHDEHAADAPAPAQAATT